MYIYIPNEIKIKLIMNDNASFKKIFPLYGFIPQMSFQCIAHCNNSSCAINNVNICVKHTKNQDFVLTKD